ncbi:unnamed protein product [Ascophyllum nodosum]
MDATTDMPVDASTEVPVDASTEAPVDASTEAPVDASTEAPVDASMDAPVDASTDAPVDSSTDTPVGASTDAPVGASADAPVGASADAPLDASTDAPVDASTDADASGANSGGPSAQGLIELVGGGVKEKVTQPSVAAAASPATIIAGGAGVESSSSGVSDATVTPAATSAAQPMPPRLSGDNAGAVEIDLDPPPSPPPSPPLSTSGNSGGYLSERHAPVDGKSMVASGDGVGGGSDLGTGIGSGNETGGGGEGGSVLGSLEKDLELTGTGKAEKRETVGGGSREDEVEGEETTGAAASSSAFEGAASEASSTVTVVETDRMSVETARREVIYLCPRCGAIVATQERMDETRKNLRIRSFKNALSKSFLLAFGVGRDVLEDDPKLGVKGSIVTKGVVGLMYGSIYEDLVDFMFRCVGLSGSDRFLDIGSGIGQVVMQAAAWAGCASAGVEIVEKRHGVSVRLLGALRSVVAAAATEGDQEEDAKLHTEALNKARLIQGDFVEKWDQVKDSTVIYLNNSGAWFKAEAQCLVTGKEPSESTIQAALDLISLGHNTSDPANLAEKASTGDPRRWLACAEVKLVGLLREMNHAVTLITMEALDDPPQAWTRREVAFPCLPETRVATYHSGEIKFQIYTTSIGPWRCGDCGDRFCRAWHSCPCTKHRKNLRDRSARDPEMYRER